MKLTSDQKIHLLKTTFKLISSGVETLAPNNVGTTLAYLMHAILYDDTIDLNLKFPEDKIFYDLCKENLEDDSVTWDYIKVKQ